MKHRLLYIPIILLLMLSFVDCAKKGSPTGGNRDSIPPLIVKSSPENYSVNFTENEIRINFDEYIKLKDIQKELIISPPLKYAPIITPLSTSKILKIKILDTLKENTTYSFNFGNSIVDNNEENPFPYFKYIFSTGSYIDSLKVMGRVTDAQLRKAETPTSIMLYDVNEEFTDSVIYNSKPTYIGTTKDSTGTFELNNLKAGKYLLLALKEKSNDYTFQPSSDKIGFVENYITLPTDSSYTLSIFKENLSYKIERPKQLGQNHIQFGYTGNGDSLAINVLSQIPENFISTTFYDSKKDTLNYWFKPSLEQDSIVFKVQNSRNIDTLTLRLRKFNKDSLSISPLNTGVSKLKDTLLLGINTPLMNIDTEKIKIINRDSVFIEAAAFIDKKYNLAKIVFPKTEDQIYTVQILPGAITDFFEQTNDSLSISLRTQPVSDYGTIVLTMQNVAQYPIILQLVDSNFRVMDEKYLESASPVLFDEINPDLYYLRIIYDENQNQKWDPGNFLKRIQPEKIIYYPIQIEVRANWSLNETFTLK